MRKSDPVSGLRLAQGLNSGFGAHDFISTIYYAIGRPNLSRGCTLYYNPFVVNMFRGRRQQGLAHRAKMGLGVGADVGETRGIGHARGLASFGVGPALALLELDGVIVEELVDGNGG